MLDYCLDIDPSSQWVIAPGAEWEQPMPFFVTEVGRFFAGPAYYTTRANKAGYYLLYTVEGSGVIETQGVQLVLPAKHGVLVRCDQLHSYRTNSAGSWLNLWAHLDGAGVDAYYRLLAWQGVAVRDSAKAEETFALLLQLGRRVDVLAAVAISAQLSLLLTAMVEDSQAQQSGQQQRTQVDMEAAITYIAQNYHRPIQMDEITQVAHYSKYHFVRLFKNYTGTTPYQYLILYRMGEAKRLLCTTDHSVAEIAWRVGYPGESNFIHQFRRLTGVTPSQFRKGHLRTGWQQG